MARTGAEILLRLDAISEELRAMQDQADALAERLDALSAEWSALQEEAGGLEEMTPGLQAARGRPSPKEVLLLRRALLRGPVPGQIRAVFARLEKLKSGKPG